MTVAAEAPPDVVDEPRRRLPHLVWGDLVAAVGILSLLLYGWWLGRDAFFYADEWDILAMFHDGHALTPFNGHLSLVPVSIFRLLALTAGWHYGAYRFVGLVGYGLLGAALYWYGRKRIPPVLAAFFALWVLAFSAADINVMFPFLINFSLPLAAMVVIGDLIERDTRRDDIIAAVLLAFSLASSAMGILATVAIATYFVLSKVNWRRPIPFIPPLVLWALWYLGYHEPNAINPGLGVTAHYAFDMVAATFIALAAGWSPGGVLVFAAFVAVLVLGVVRWKTVGPEAIRWFAAGAFFVAITSYTRIGTQVPGQIPRPYIPPDTGRYTWVLTIFLVLGLCEVLRGVALPIPSIAVVGVVVALGGLVLVGDLQEYHAGQLRYRRTATTALKGVDAVGDKADPERILPLSFIPVRVKDYLRLTHHIGEPFADAGLKDMGKVVDRQLADTTMAKELGVQLQTPTGTSCTTSTSGKGEVTLEPGQRAVITAGNGPAGVRIARFSPTVADTFPWATVDAGQSRVLAFPEDHSSLPWHVYVDSGGSVSVCD